MQLLIVGLPDRLLNWVAIFENHVVTLLRFSLERRLVAEHIPRHQIDDLASLHGMLIEASLAAIELVTSAALARSL